MPLWYGNLEYRRDWDNRGYHIVRDIMNENGELLTKVELNAKGLKINLLDYFRIQQKVKTLEKRVWKTAQYIQDQVSLEFSLK